MIDRPVLGLTEPVTIIGNDNEESAIARIDTGATASSIDLGLASRLALGPIIKSKIVKSASGVVKRPIVMAKIRLNGTILEAEFTLADRGHMTFPLLVGQNILKEGNFLIDPKKVNK